jgi:non-specific serine/threonine protein kinase
VSTFIGRSQDLTEIRRLLAERRLVTLTGPGGSGKTTLALRVVETVLTRFADGVWLVEFAPVRDPSLVPQTVAAVLSVRERPGQNLVDSLIDTLQLKSALLLFDNCEHLDEAPAQLAAQLLAACPQVRILATSREPLGVPGEVLWRVEPLSVPNRQPWRNPSDTQEALNIYRQSEAVLLFVDRAKAVAPLFSLTTDNAPWVAEICRRLDGMPLAIELAAARVPTLSSRQIAERLDDRFPLLTSRLHTAPERHQTLEAALDWSHDLLSEKEQALFRRLSVFTGSWTLPAAEAVGVGDGIAQDEVLELLAELVHKSLVVVDDNADERRYSYLETIRVYAVQRLIAAKEESAILEKHLNYFLNWAETHAHYLSGPQQRQWVPHFESEHANIRAALEWGRTHEQTAVRALRLAIGCGHFWRIRGYNSEGRRHLQTLLAMPINQAATLQRAEGLWCLTVLTYQQSDFKVAQSTAEETLAIGRQLGSVGRMITARATDMLGEVLTETGELDKALSLLEKSLAIYRDLGDERGTANMLMQVGWARMRAGAYEAAEHDLREGLNTMRLLGEPRRTAQALGGLGELAIRRGRLDEAEELLSESVDLYWSTGDRWGIAASMGSLGWMSLRQRQFGRMGEYMAESIDLRLAIGETGGLAWCLEKLAEGIALQARLLTGSFRRSATQRAATVLGAAAVLRADKDSQIDAADWPDYERLLKELRRALGDTDFEAAWVQGGKLALPDAVELALAPVEAQPATATDGNGEPDSSLGGLSPRERETAVLIAQGKSNREIAAAMVVREKTIETYVTRILNKLGFDSRVQVATWAVRNGLLGEDDSRS